MTAAVAMMYPVSIPSGAGSREQIDLEAPALNFQKIENPQASLNQCSQRYGTQAIRSVFEKLALNNKTSVYEELNLADNICGDDGARYLAEGLKGNTSLKRLIIPRAQIKSKGFQALGSLLADAPSLEMLILSSNTCDAEGVGGEFAKGLQANKKLRSLYIASCRIGDEGVKHLCNGPLLAHPALEHISLEYNRLELAAASSLSSVLASNKVLQYLDICGNSIGPEGAEALVEGLKKNKGCLKKLGVAQNDLGLRGTTALAKHFMTPEGQALGYLDLRHNLTTYRGMQELRKLLGRPMSDDPTEGPGWLLLFGERQLYLNAH